MKLILLEKKNLRINKLNANKKAKKKCKLNF